MIKSLTVIFCLMIGFATLGQNGIDYQNKRLSSSLKKKGISGFSQLEEINAESKNVTDLPGKFFTVANNGEVDKMKYVFVGRVNSCRAGGCCNTANLSENLESEYFEYIIYFDSQKTVQLVEVFNYQATHGYEITSKGWLKQFVGYSAIDELIVNKDIDGITGATVSVYAITNDIQGKTKILNQIK